MPLFQKPASTPEELERSRPLALAPEAVDKLDEDAWYAQAYRGDDVPQLTVRAVVTGAGLGCVMAFSNVYVSLKTGWLFGVALTSCILSFALWNALVKMRVARSAMSILETNCMQSAASAAGTSTASMTSAAIPALLLLSVSAGNPDGRPLPWPVVAGWIFFAALFGVVLAIPMKRNMINRERLRFPSGTAAATLLQSLYTAGGDAGRKARALSYAALVSATTPLLMDLNVFRGNALVPSISRLFDWLPARGIDPKTGTPVSLSDWGIVLDHKLLMVAAGMMVGLRVSISMLVGALVLALFIGPAGLASGAVTAPSQAWFELGIWVGAPILVSSGVLSLAFQWRTLARAFRGLGGVADGAKAHVEAPRSWFVWGTAVAGLGLIVLGHAYFQIPLLWGVVAVAMTAVLSLVAARVTGESDVTPAGPMGSIVQLTYGVILPQNPAANLMTASISASSSSASADLLTDLKSGYLLGANPRRQFIAQLIAIVPGTLAVVLAYYLLVPDARPLIGTPTVPATFPAPFAQSFLAIAHLFQNGISSLNSLAQVGIVAGLVVGGILVLLEAVLPRHKKWFPSATGLGLGMIIPFQYPLSFFIGAVIAWIWMRRWPPTAERYLVPVSSGLIAGESIVGVAVAAVNNLLIGR